MAIYTNIPDAIQAVVTLMVDAGIDIKFDFGHPKDIQRMLISKTKDPALKSDKYPLLILFLDYEEDRNQSEKQYLTQATVNLALVTETGKNYTPEQRKETSFKEVLWPLYEQFLYFMEQCNLFETNTYSKLPHTKYDRYYYGDEAKTQNSLTAYLDAVEILNLELSLFNQCDAELPMPLYYNVVHQTINVIHEGNNVVYKAYN